MLTSQAVQRERYLDAVEALAAQVFAEVSHHVTGEDFLEEALVELAKHESAGSSEHAWIFRDPAVLLLSDHLFEALDDRPDGRRDWFHADLASAIAAVARFDVMAGVVDRANEAADDEEDGLEAAGLKA